MASTSTLTLPERTVGREPRRIAALQLTLLLLAAMAHIVAVWGHTGLFWGDVGVLLHQIELFAQGYTPYEDFYWIAPPLSLWLVGLAERALGSAVEAFMVTMAVTYLLIIATYWFYVRRLLPPGWRLPAAAVTALMAASQAMPFGAPIPLGTHIIASPIGFLILLLAAVLTLGLSPRYLRTAGFVIGSLAGLCILTKQDFWLPATYVMVVSAFYVAHLGGRRVAFLPVAGFVVTVVGGILLVVAGSGWDSLPGAATGFGFAAEFGIARGLPSWERVTAQIAGSSTIVLALACALWAGGLRTRGMKRSIIGALCLAVLATCVYVSVSYAIFRSGATGEPSYTIAPVTNFLIERGESGRSFVATMVKLALETVQRDSFPGILLLVPLVLVLVRIRRHRGDRDTYLLLLLLLFCVAARGRRAFEMTGWFHVMLELPVYLLTLKVLFSGYQRYATRLLLLGTLAAGIFMYWYNGVGAFTRRGTYPMQQTEAGVVRWRANEARDYRMIREGLNEIDPSGERAVLSFGHNGGFQYFLRRPNAAPTAHFGISVGIQPPESLVAAVKRMDPPPFLIDNTLYRGVGVPAPRISLTSWEQPTMLNHYERRDRPWFEALMEDCSFAFAVPGTRLPLLRVYDCAR